MMFGAPVPCFARRLEHDRLNIQRGHYEMAPHVTHRQGGQSFIVSSACRRLVRDSNLRIRRLLNSSALVGSQKNSALPHTENLLTRVSPVRAAKQPDQ